MESGPPHMVPAENLGSFDNTSEMVAIVTLHVPTRKLGHTHHMWFP
jgi:hypothetical protein